MFAGFKVNLKYYNFTIIMYNDVFMYVCMYVNYVCTYVYCMYVCTYYIIKVYIIMYKIYIAIVILNTEEPYFVVL